MNVNQNRALYLGWLRTAQPALYNAAVLGTVRDHLTRSLKGLGDDSDFSADVSLEFAPIDPIAFDAPSINYDTGPSVSSGVTSLTSSSSLFNSLSSAGSGLFSSILGAAPQLANTYVQSQGQLDLLNINTQRAKQGLPPLTNVNGTQVTAAQLAPANAATLQMEQALSSMGGSTGLLLMLGIGVVALVALSGKK